MTEAEMQYSAEWWESRSSHELNELVRRGLSAGGIFYGAARELERRAREADRHARETDAAASQHKKRVMHRATLGLLLLCMALALAIVARVMMHPAAQTVGQGTDIE